METCNFDIIIIMLDFRFIKENIGEVKENTKKRNANADPELVVHLFDKRGGLIQRIEELRRKRNQNAAAMKGKLSSEDRTLCIEEGKALKQRISGIEDDLSRVEKELRIEAVKIPNMSHPESPVGETEADNKELKRWGTAPRFSFPPKDHVVIGRECDILDFDRGTKVAGQKFYFLKNEGVFLELALIRYALDFLAEEGFLVTITPDFAREDIVEGIGFQPRGPESNIYTVEGINSCLIGTAEITLGGYYEKEMLDPERFPIKLAGYSHCFRREAGAAGQYSKGLYRVHQFSKVEMFIYCHPEQSEQMLSYLLSIEERIFQGLGVPYRVVDTCTGDLGGPAYRKFDIEAWMPGRGIDGEYGEITSASNCTDYQARRLGIRFKENGVSRYAHMLNGTAIAASRAFLSILENYQHDDGSVSIPEGLREYTGFDRISRKTPQ